MADDPVLIDTSGWVAFFRGDPPAADVVAALLDDDRVVLCGPVEMELRRGLRDHERKRVLPLLDALPSLPIEASDFRVAGDLLRELRTRGVTIPSLDGLIATLAMRHDVSLLALDRHFEGIDGLRLAPANV